MIRQPDITPQVHHSPLNGETILENTEAEFFVNLENFDGEKWNLEEEFRESRLDLLLRGLRKYTPQGSVWSGALSYDLVQWTSQLNCNIHQQKGKF